MAWPRPSASRIWAWRRPSARRMFDAFSPSAVLMAACFWPSATLMADCCWPSDCRMAARFSWSACFCRAIAIRICWGGTMSTISIRLMRMPHLSVTCSICICSWALICSRWLSASSRLIDPKTARRVVRLSWSTAMK